MIRFIKRYTKDAVYLFLLIFCALAACSCSNETEEIDKDNANAKKPLSLYVGVYSWSANSTRAGYSNMTELNGYKNFPITFTSGDAIGIFIVDKSGSVTVANHKYTFNGSSWTTDDPVKYVTGMGSYTYYAYYPYQESLSGAYSVGDNITSGMSDTDFFAYPISYWSPNADQSTLAGFTGSDLMTAKGTVQIPLYQEVHVSFVMRHRMGLLVTKSELSYYDEDDTSDTWTVTQSFTTNVPYAIGEELYYIAKPDQETTLGSKTATVGSGEVEQLYFPNGEPSSR